MSVADNIGLIANCSLWVFGNTHRCADLEPEGITESAMDFGRILRTMDGEVSKDLLRRFSILKKCRNKFVCLVNEMLFIRDLKPTLRVHSDSICAKVFV